MDNKIFESVDEYISDYFVPQDEALLAAERSLEEEDMPPISVSPNQGKFLQMLALLCGAKKILEVGTLAGYSTIWMARALPEDGTLITLEYDAKHARVARKNIERAGLGSKVEVRVGKGLDLLPELANEQAGPFDLIFIDADKPPYVEYFQWALKLSRPGTLIIADNVIRDGKVLDAASQDEMVKGAQRFNKMLSQNNEVTATILQMVGVKDHDGMALAIVK
ncbi:MAG TPA: O-methyltransferase [Cyclobacteriaceae bacterium]|nr:O-methyltransferase [Cyclobacteriaceae bacterium]